MFIKFEIPDNVLPIYLDAFAKFKNYSAQIIDPNDPEKIIPNPITPEQNLIAAIVKYAEEMAFHYRSKDAVDQAKKTAETTVLAEITISDKQSAANQPINP